MTQPSTPLTPGQQLDEMLAVLRADMADVNNPAGAFVGAMHDIARLMFNAGLYAPAWVQLPADAAGRAPRLCWYRVRDRTRAEHIGRTWDLVVVAPGLSDQSISHVPGAWRSAILDALPALVLLAVENQIANHRRLMALLNRARAVVRDTREALHAVNAASAE